MASVKYKLKRDNRIDSDNLIYARAFHDETISLEQLSEHMSNHNSPYSEGTIKGVLTDMVSCIRELLLDSKKVKLDNLAIFSLGLKGTGAESVEKFSVSSNIKSAHINALGTGSFSKRELDTTVRFQEVGEYQSGK
ncbi:MAG: DNA-binding protein [Prevotella sp.]|nr:DNA-binding protein [Prevotella sp.]